MNRLSRFPPLWPIAAACIIVGLGLIILGVIGGFL
jgi:hypothetical protein